jgi:flagellar assembly factor FliW
MPELETTNFGPIAYSEASVFEFPRGLPGFEERHRFVPVQNPGTAPVVFLQSVDVPSLCFTTLPVFVVDPGYHLQIAEQDLETLGFACEVQPRIGKDVLCLAVLSLREDGATANLLAPVVVNLKTRAAVQAVMEEVEYSHQHSLGRAEVTSCS